MKKAIKIVLVVILIVYAGVATIAATEFRAECEELRTENVESFDPVDLLPYKLFYDALVQDLRGNDYDWEKAVDDVTAEYGLSEAEQLTLLENAEWLMGMVSVFAEE